MNTIARSPLRLPGRVGALLNEHSVARCASWITRRSVQRNSDVRLPIDLRFERTHVDKLAGARRESAESRADDVPVVKLDDVVAANDLARRVHFSLALGRHELGLHDPVRLAWVRVGACSLCPEN